MELIGEEMLSGGDILSLACHADPAFPFDRLQIMRYHTSLNELVDGLLGDPHSPPNLNKIQMLTANAPSAYCSNADAELLRCFADCDQSIHVFISLCFHVTLNMLEY